MSTLRLRKIVAMLWRTYLEPRPGGMRTASFDFENIMVTRWLNLDMPGSAIHPFGETAIATIAGGHDPPA